MIKRAAKIFFPPHTKRGAALKRAAVRAGLAKPFNYDEKYQVWLQNAEEHLFLDPITDHKPQTGTPLFSVVIPMYNTADKYLDPLLNSIVDQSFGDWELILADGSTDELRQAAIKRGAESDSRIKYVKLKQNLGISENTNEAIERARGTYIVFVDHDDTLSLHALNEFARVVIDKPETDIIYSDEDKLTDDGKYRFWPQFKSNWSPHQFLSCNYTNHLSAIRASLVREAGLLQTEYNGAQDYNLLLKVHSLDKPIVAHHVPKVLYHWRLAEGSTAGDFSIKQYALDAGVRSLEGFYKAKHVAAEVAPIQDRPGFYASCIKPAAKQKVLVIVGRQEAEAMSKSVVNRIRSFTATDDFLKVEFITETAYLAKHAARKADDAFDFVVRIKENTMPKSAVWLSDLCGTFALGDVYAVSPRIVAYDGRIWDMGLIKDASGDMKQLFRGMMHNDDTIYGHTEWIRDVDALNGNFYMVKAADYDHDAVTIQSSKKGKYTVVWSLVETTFYGKLKPVSGQYNENIELSKEGKKTVLWQ